MSVEEALVDVREHAERRGMDDGVEMMGGELFLEQRLGSADLAERAYAVGIASDERNLRAGIGKRARRPTGRASVAHDQHLRFGELHQARKRTGDAGRVGI